MRGFLVMNVAAPAATNSDGRHTFGDSSGGGCFSPPGPKKKKASNEAVFPDDWSSTDWSSWEGKTSHRLRQDG